jgi:hypothetical protein
MHTSTARAKLPTALGPCKTGRARLAPSLAARSPQGTPLDPFAEQPHPSVPSRCRHRHHDLMHYCPPSFANSPIRSLHVLAVHRLASLTAPPAALPSMTKPAPSAPAASPIPIFYRLVFLYIEPVSTLLGAIHAHYLQSKYLSLTHAASFPSVIPLGTSIVLSQLANLYLLLCINEALVLRVTNDPKVWRAFILGLLIADLGHLYSVRLVGSWVYYEFWNWNAIDWGNVPFVYWLAVVRCFFLAGVGFKRDDVRWKGM